MITLRMPSHFPARATEWMFAGEIFALGLLLLMPMQHMMFSAPYFAGFGGVQAQHPWGYAGLLCGGIHLTALYVNGTRRLSPHVRAFCSLVGMGFWLLLCFGLYRGEGPGLSWVLCPFHVMFSGINAIRAGGEAGRSDERATNAHFA